MKRLSPFLLGAILIATLLPLTQPAHGQGRKPDCTVREGVEFYRAKNFGKAFECWDQNARRGNSAAQFNIARMYVLGEGVPRNLTHAYAWMMIADRSGRPEARKALASLRKQMTKEQLAEAEQRVQRFYTHGRR